MGTRKVRSNTDHLVVEVMNFRCMRETYVCQNNSSTETLYDTKQSDVTSFSVHDKEGTLFVGDALYDTSCSNAGDLGIPVKKAMGDVQRFSLCAGSGAVRVPMSSLFALHAYHTKEARAGAKDFHTLSRLFSCTVFLHDLLSEYRNKPPNVQFHEYMDEFSDTQIQIEGGSFKYYVQFSYRFPDYERLNFVDKDKVSHLDLKIDSDWPVCASNDRINISLDPGSYDWANIVTDLMLKGDYHLQKDVVSKFFTKLDNDMDSLCQHSFSLPAFDTCKSNTVPYHVKCYQMQKVFAQQKSPLPLNNTTLPGKGGNLYSFMYRRYNGDGLCLSVTPFVFLQFLAVTGTEATDLNHAFETLLSPKPSCICRASEQKSCGKFLHCKTAVETLLWSASQVANTRHLSSMTGYEFDTTPVKNQDIPIENMSFSNECTHYIRFRPVQAKADTSSSVVYKVLDRLGRIVGMTAGDDKGKPGKYESRLVYGFDDCETLSLYETNIIHSMIELGKMQDDKFNKYLANKNVTIPDQGLSECFRNMCKALYQLDSANTYSADTALLTTQAPNIDSSTNVQAKAGTRSCMTPCTKAFHLSSDVETPTPGGHGTPLNLFVNRDNTRNERRLFVDFIESTGMVRSERFGKATEVKINVQNHRLDTVVPGPRRDRGKVLDATSQTISTRMYMQSVPMMLAQVSQVAGTANKVPAFMQPRLGSSVESFYDSIVSAGRFTFMSLQTYKNKAMWVPGASLVKLLRNTDGTRIMSVDEFEKFTVEMDQPCNMVAIEMFDPSDGTVKEAVQKLRRYAKAVAPPIVKPDAQHRIFTAYNQVSTADLSRFIQDLNARTAVSCNPLDPAAAVRMPVTFTRLAEATEMSTDLASYVKSSVAEINKGMRNMQFDEEVLPLSKNEVVAFATVHPLSEAAAPVGKGSKLLRSSQATDTFSKVTPPPCASF